MQDHKAVGNGVLRKLTEKVSSVLNYSCGDCQKRFSRFYKTVLKEVSVTSKFHCDILLFTKLALTFAVQDAQKGHNYFSSEKHLREGAMVMA